MRKVKRRASMLDPKPSQTAEAALLEALARIFEPAARLAVARGLSFAAVEGVLKRAFVLAGRNLASTDGAAPTVSGIATATGLTRREVTRLMQEGYEAAAYRPSVASEVFTRWRGDRRLRSSHGLSKPLPRLGPAPSFEALAQSVTRDVHPRTVLDELCRLGLARLDTDTDQVHLTLDGFVPQEDQAGMLAFLGANVGAHLAASVANVLNESRKHFEQAIYADELSDESIVAAKKLVNAQWRAVLAALVPDLEALVEADRKALERNRAHRANRSLRIGLYSFDEEPKPDEEHDT
jgi:Family of unknown function (DUF6502)